MTGLDAVHQLMRLAGCRHEIEPATRDHQVRAQTEDTIGDRIPMVMIVEEPSVKVALTQRRLDASEIHGVNCNCGSYVNLLPSQLSSFAPRRGRFARCELLLRRGICLL